MTKTKPTKSTAKDVFSYLLMIITLIMSVVSFISLLFMYIEYQFPFVPDSIYDMRTGIQEGIRAMISILVVAWPVYLVLAWFIMKDLKKHKEKANLWVRKWLLHFALFASALAIIIDLITLINYFLDGDLTVRFALKVVTVLLVAAALFGYYLWELRRDVKLATKVPLVSAIIGSVVIIGFITANFFIIGTPAQQRDVRMDDERVEHLQDLQGMIVTYWEENNELPASLDGLGEEVYGISTPVDPETGAAYRYLPGEEYTFQLCATFESKSETGDDYYFPSHSFRIKGYQNWSHGIGEECFDLEIDPEVYDEVIIKDSEAPVFID
jgi:hypothetical protein